MATSSDPGARPDSPGDPDTMPDFTAVLKKEAKANDSVKNDAGKNDASPESPAADTMRDFEKSLVERIADVDDERRRTSTQVRKALAAHRDEVDDFLRGDRQLVLFAAALSAVSLVVVLWLVLGGTGRYDGVYQRLVEAERQLAAVEQQLAALASESASLAETAIAAAAETASGPVPELAELGRRVEDLTAALDDLSAQRQVAEGEVQRQLTQIEQRMEQIRGAAAGQRDGSHSAGQALEQRLASDAAQVRETLAALERRLGALEQRLTGDAETLIALDGRLDTLEQQLSDDVTQQGETLAALEGRLDSLDAQMRAEFQRPAVSAGSGPSADQAVAPSADESVRTDAPEGVVSLPGDEPMLILDAPHVALQLVGYHNRADLDRFVAAHRLPQTLYLRREPYQDRPGYSLIYGLYPDAATANSVRSTLPEPLRQLDHWLRELPAGTELQRLRGSDPPPAPPPAS